MKMDEEDHKPRQALRKNNKKSEKALSQADFPKNPVISFSVLRAILKDGLWAVFFVVFKWLSVSIMEITVII